MDKPENQEQKQEQLPDLGQLSLSEMEALIARKRQEESHKRLRQMRAQTLTPTPRAVQEAVLPTPVSELPVAAPPSVARAVPTPSAPSAPSARPPARPVPVSPPPVTNEQRFRPMSFEVKRKGRQKEKRESSHRLRDLLGYTLETLVIIAVLVIFGNWVLQQFGISINLFDLGRSSVSHNFTPSRREGLLLSASASGAIAVQLPPTVAAASGGVASPVTLATPSVQDSTPAAAPVLANAPTAEPNRVVSPTATPTNLAVVAPAPTPTPVIIQAKPPAPNEVTGPDEATRIPARRLVIPRIGLDSLVKEVTVDLGNWQIADFAVGHHLGTANPGQVGNMVLAGHRDIRGSIFLRLNELQMGDEIKIFTDKALYRYIVSEISEVAPTEVSVMYPTVEPTATLITCTPIGYATRRLIIRARLQD